MWLPVVPKWSCWQVSTLMFNMAGARVWGMARKDRAGGAYWFGLLRWRRFHRWRRRPMMVFGCAWSWKLGETEIRFFLNQGDVREWRGWWSSYWNWWSVASVVRGWWWLGAVGDGGEFVVSGGLECGWQDLEVTLPVSLVWSEIVFVFFFFFLFLWSPVLCCRWKLKWVVFMVLNGWS